MPDETRRTQANRAESWSRLLVVAMLACLVVVLGRVAQLKIVPGPKLRPAMAPRQSTRPEPARSTEYPHKPPPDVVSRHLMA